MRHAAKADPAASPAPTRARIQLIWQILLTGICYSAITLLSPRFEHNVSGTSRPIWFVLGLFWVAFVLYWWTLYTVRQLDSNNRLAVVLFGAAIVFRAIMLPSVPIQEIDIYRYLWDGAVGASGTNPYRYTPHDVLDAHRRGVLSTEAPRDFIRLTAMIDDDAALVQILERVHFSELPTPYPPASQIVFTASAMLLPEECPAELRLLVLKCVLTGFDLATMALLLWILRLTGSHVGWSVAYGWCPLVVKEFANSGHLDAIAIFFTTLAMAITVRSIFRVGDDGRTSLRDGFHKLGSRPNLSAVAAAAALAVGVGAKLYPLFLVPLLVASWWRRQGCQVAMCGLAVFIAMTALCLAPWFMTRQVPAGPLFDRSVDASLTRVEESKLASGNESPAPAPITETSAPTANTSATRPTDGIWEFLKRWEMNDLVYMLVVENLRPQSKVAPAHRPWFVFVPETWSQWCVDQWSNLLTALGRAVGKGGGPEAAMSLPISITNLGRDPFIASSLLARTIIACVFTTLAIALAVAAGNANTSSSGWLRAAFLTLAWCWLLAPTQNPWYLCWALPLLPFAGRTAWFALPALAMIYYLRFWLEYHFPGSVVLGTRYDGAYFFHFVVVWVEFGPWFLWLGVESLWRPRRRNLLTRRWGSKTPHL